MGLDRAISSPGASFSTKPAAQAASAAATTSGSLGVDLFGGGLLEDGPHQRLIRGGRL